MWLRNDFVYHSYGLIWPRFASSVEGAARPAVRGQGFDSPTRQFFIFSCFQLKSTRSQGKFT